MANLLNFDASQLTAFILVIIRIGGIVFTAPILGHVNVPDQIKVALAFVLSLMLFPFIPPIRVFPQQTHEFLLLVGSELLIGVVLGMIGRLLFAAIEFAGELTGFQMGLSMANVFDPQSEQQVSMISQFESILATLLFLAMDAHHVVLQAMVQSYQLLPPGSAGLTNALMENILLLSAGIFSLGFQIGAPLVISLFMANMIMGLLSRSVPQIQILVVGVPLTILVGFAFLWIGMPYFVQSVRILFEMYDDQVLQILHLLKKP